MAVVEIDRPEPGISRITLNRPDRLNAMTSELVQLLHEALDKIGSDSACRVVVLTGAGRGFCAGLDLGGYGPVPRADAAGIPQQKFATQKHIADLVPHLRSIPQPVIAAVNGPATGGGLAIALASDIRIAAQTARFSAAFIRVGYSACDIGTSWLLPRLVGASRAHELMLTGRLFDADEAKQIGLVTDVTPDETLFETVVEKARQIIDNSPFGVALTKEAMWTALEIPGMRAAIDLENRQQIMVSFTEDHAEAVAAFKQRRAPRFENR